MLKLFKANIEKFMSDDSGAVTVDWVVLCAAIVGISLAVILTISGGAITYAEFVSGDLEAIAYAVGFGS